MGEFLTQYGLFLAKSVTVVAALAVLVFIVASARRRGGGGGHGLDVEKLNHRYEELGDQLRRAVLTKGEWRKEAKRLAKERKARDKGKGQKIGQKIGQRNDQRNDQKGNEAGNDGHRRRRVFVLDFRGDIKATAVASLREEVSAVVAVATPQDEVVLRIENFGGVVHEHGLAASQLARLRARGIPMTAIVDKGAASGGYMMACIANRIVAAPFAVLGSIGVLAQLPNFNRALTERGIDFEQVTAGRYKRTVTMFGKTTDDDRAKLREELEEVHHLFKQLVARNRPSLDVEAVATGEHWYGERALELGLVDEIGASDDYLLKAVEDADVYRVAYQARHTLQERVLAAVRALADQVVLWMLQRDREGRLP